MENAKDKGSRSGSKSDLNESSLPLLEGSEEVDLKGGDVKVSIEMETRSSDDNAKEEGAKGEGADSKESAKDEKAAKKKEKKEKKKKKENKETNSVPLAERLTAGLNLLDRDDRGVNDHVNILFEDVLAEPDAAHGFDLSWRLAFIAFSGTKTWLYKVIAVVLSIPCAVLWAIVFSLLTVVNVWLVSPTLRVFFIIMHILHKVWSALIHTFLDPVFKSLGQMFSAVHVSSAVNMNKSCIHQEVVKEP